MSATIVDPPERFVVDAQDQTILEAIREQGIEFIAPCGGARACGRCQVLVRDDSGLHFVLACKTRIEEGMEIHLEPHQAMAIQDAGIVSAEGAFGYQHAMEAWHLTWPSETSADAAQSGGDASGRAGEAGGRSGYGLAIDIGTTTMVCRLHDLETGTLIASNSRVNPQVGFGADVVSRIDAAMNGHLNEMCDLVRNVLADMADALCRAAGVDRTTLADAALVGNTVMEHIAARIPPDSLGIAPYDPASHFGGYGEFAPVSSKAYFAPVIAGYVGGDVTAGIMIPALYETQDVRLYVDLGTNGEVVLADKGSLYSCATAAGPVFEGASIRCGMPARAGAIAGVMYDGETLRLPVIENAEPTGICGTGLIDAVAFMLERGIMDETGRLLASDEVPLCWADRTGERDGKRIFLLDVERDIYLTQEDIRQVQLAKAAICAGILTLLEERGLAVGEVDSLIIAGGFGSYLDVESAARIGLFPSELGDRVQNAGNLAIEGASLLLVSPTAREAACEIAFTCDYIELSTSETFSKRYLECMMF